MRKKTTVRDLVIIVGGLAIAALLYTFASAYLVMSPVPGAEVPPAGEISLRGMITCLPHKDAKGPQTLECAFGFLDEQGLYYGLRDSNPQYKNVSGVAMNTPVTIEGYFTPQNDTRYQSIGVIDVQSIMEEGAERRAGISGVFVCLPYQESVEDEGVCQIGIQTDDGSHYVIDLGPLSQTMPRPQVGDHFSANGMYIPLEIISNDQWRKYDIQGIFSVTSIVESSSVPEVPE